MNKSKGMGNGSSGFCSPLTMGRRVLSGGVLLGMLLFSAPPGHGEALSQKEAYLQSIVTLMRLHANAIRQLATHEFKYSRNLARHATALHNTFGLLGPMDWHVAEAASLQKKNGEGPMLAADMFEKMAEQCQKSMKDLYQAAIHQLEKGGGPQPVLRALDDVQGKCNSCHALLDGVAPDVWGARDQRP